MKAKVLNKKIIIELLLILIIVGFKICNSQPIIIKVIKVVRYQMVLGEERQVITTPLSLA